MVHRNYRCSQWFDQEKSIAGLYIAYQILRIKNFKEICRNCSNREDDSDAINPFWRHGHYKLLMCIKYNGHLDNVHLTKNKLYEVIRLEGGWFRILNDAGEVEKYPPFLFEVYNFFG